MRGALPRLRHAAGRSGSRCAPGGAAGCRRGYPDAFTSARLARGRGCGDGREEQLCGGPPRAEIAGSHEREAMTARVRPEPASPGRSVHRRGFGRIRVDELAELHKRALLKLTDPLAGKPELLPRLGERVHLVVVEPVAQTKDRLFAPG